MKWPLVLLLRGTGQRRWKAGRLGEDPLPLRLAVILVRHASTAWSGIRYCGRSDPPLDAAGESAAALLAGVRGIR